MKTVNPDNKIIEWDSYAEWPAEDGGTYHMSRPKDQGQDEPDTPASSQNRTLGWTGYSPTVRELRGWLDKIPDQATIEIRTIVAAGSYSITATWENP